MQIRLLRRTLSRIPWNITNHNNLISPRFAFQPFVERSSIKSCQVSEYCKTFLSGRETDRCCVGVGVECETGAGAGNQKQVLSGLVWSCGRTRSYLITDTTTPSPNNIAG